MASCDAEIQMILPSAVYRKWTSTVVDFYIFNLSIVQSSRRVTTFLAKSPILHTCKSSSLERLDHRDWLAPNEVLKIFSSITDADQVIGALKKVSNRKDYKPTEALYMLIIDKLAYAGKFDYIEDLLERIKLEKCRLSDEFFYTVIKVYANVANHPEQAIKTLLNMPDYHCWPTVKMVNLVLNMLVCSKHYEIIHEVYLCTTKLGIAVDTCCFNILIKGLCNCGKLDAAFSLLHEMPKQRCKPNVTTYSTLMHALCKHDRVNEALELYERMEGEDVHPDTISFNILIFGLCRQGKLKEGMEFLHKMKLKGCSPNSGTFQAILYGFLNFEKFEDAKSFMNKMVANGASPSISSYKSLINGLCNDNLLNDAEIVLKQMVGQGYVPRMGIWKKILGCMSLKIPDCEFES